MHGSAALRLQQRLAHWGNSLQSVHLVLRYLGHRHACEHVHKFAIANDKRGYRRIAEVRDELLAGVDAAVRAGVDPAKLIIDPGLGFAKTAEHNWALLRALPELVGIGIPVLVGASRKRFLGSLLTGPDGELRGPNGRETATAVISALAGLHGAWGVRVHDVRASADALKVLEAWSGAHARMGDDREIGDG